MSLVRQLLRGLRALTRRAADEDRGEEARQYFESATAGLIESGLTPADAKRAARIELGSMTGAREQVRSQGWENAIGTAWADLGYAARRLRRRPGFAATAILTLALGIGASTAIFSAVNPILFESLPYPGAAKIVMIWDVFEGQRSDVTFHTYRELAARSHSFDSMAVFEPWQPAMTGAAEPERLDGQQVSLEYFRVLGTEPSPGRAFDASECRFHGPHVAILSNALWRRRFGGDRAIVGREITLDGDGYTVVGVMPASFENVLSRSAEIWRPMQYDPAHATTYDTAEWGHHLRMVGRLRGGVRIQDARSELNTIARAPAPEFPRPRWAALKNGFVVNSLQGELTRGVRPALMAILGAVMLLLVIACVNVTNLLIARGTERRGEFAMRAALGASRSRLIRQLLTESLLLALLGGAGGMLIARAGIRGLIALSPPELPRLSAITIDAGVFWFALAATVLVGLAVGLAPAIHASRSEADQGLRHASRRTAGGRHAVRRILVVSEVALALVLLISAGLLWRSLRHLFAVTPGFDAAHVLTMEVQTTGHRFEDDAVKRRFFAEALDAVRRVPGVRAAALTSLLPFSGDENGVYGAQFENRRGYDVFRYVVTPGYLETMGIALRSGRMLDAHDNASAQPAVLISESLARHQFGGQDPLGKRVHVGPQNRPWYVITGVVDDVKQTSLAESEPDAVYITSAQSWFADDVLSLVVRTRDNAAAPAPVIRRAVWSVDKDQPVVGVSTMNDLLARSAAQRRFALILFEAFGLAALLLTATGIYGVLSGSVADRTREIGVRAALGASRGDILALVVGQGMKLAGIGAAIGLAGAALASRALVSLLFGISNLDPGTYAAVVLLLLGVAAVACWEPAWRAARIDPVSAIGAE